MAGAIPAGSILVQERLCETYDVSRIPVRDALIALLHEGFVVRNHRNQMVATRFSMEDVFDTFKIEALLCGFGARRAAANMTDDDLTRLDQLLRRAELAGDPPDRSIAASVAWEFHRIINRAASSPRLTASLRAVTITFAQDHMREVPDWWRESRRHHREILEALVVRDAAEAEHRMRRHFELAGEWFAGFLGQRALQPSEPGVSTPDDDRPN